MKVYVEIERGAEALAAEDTDGQRPLSEIEDGVFSFVLLKVLQLLQERVGAERDITFKLEGVYGTLAALSERFNVEDTFLCLSFRVQFDGRPSFARVYVPEALVKEGFPADVPAEGPALDRWLRRLCSIDGLLAGVHTHTAVLARLHRLGIRLVADRRHR